MAGFDDNDFEMDDIQGEVTTVAETPEVLPAVIAEPTEKKERTYEDIVASLGEVCKKTWICVPRDDGKVEIAELTDCSPELFFEWINYIWPQAQTMKHEASDYKQLKHREIAHRNICNFYKLIQPVPRPPTKKKAATK